MVKKKTCNQLPCRSLQETKDTCSFGGHESILTVACIWKLCSQRDERHVSRTLRSIISCSSCTISSLRLSCRVDILCSSSSLRCLTEKTSCTEWSYHNVMSMGKQTNKKEYERLDSQTCVVPLPQKTRAITTCMICCGLSKTVCYKLHSWPKRHKLPEKS